MCPYICEPLDRRPQPISKSTGRADGELKSERFSGQAFPHAELESTET